MAGMATPSDTPAPFPPMSWADQQTAALAERWPGWRIWHVLHAFDMSYTWCAQRLPLLNEASPEDLDKAIAEAQAAHREEDASDPAT